MFFKNRKRNKARQSVCNVAYLQHHPLLHSISLLTDFYYGMPFLTILWSVLKRECGRQETEDCFVVWRCYCQSPAIFQTHTQSCRKTAKITGALPVVMTLFCSLTTVGALWPATVQRNTSHWIVFWKTSLCLPSDPILKAGMGKVTLPWLNGNDLMNQRQNDVP